MIASQLDSPYGDMVISPLCTAVDTIAPKYILIVIYKNLRRQRGASSQSSIWWLASVRIRVFNDIAIILYQKHEGWWRWKEQKVGENSQPQQSEKHYR